MNFEFLKSYYILFELIFTVFIYLNFSDCYAQETQSISALSESHPTNLFLNDQVLDISISGNIKELVNDRGDEPIYHSMLLSYPTGNNSFDTILLNIKTRGHFRRSESNCIYPPLLLDFSNSELPPSSPFSGQGKLKLVTPCRDDEYDIREFLVYKIYTLVTEQSFRARLSSVVFNDVNDHTITKPMYMVILESEDKMAERNHTISISREKILPENTSKQDFLKMAVFEYLIGNTDWSVQYLQNIKLLYADTTGIPVTVPYDFDHAGIVNAPYAKPAPELKMVSVRDRRYRGYCLSDLNELNETFDFYNRIKPAIYNLYQSNTLLDKNYITATLKYLDKFYATINDPDKSKKEFTYPCLPGGTGNVVIRGLK